MRIFRIDEQNQITAFASPQDAAAATTTSFDSFSSQPELTALVVDWPVAKLVSIWNSLPGVTPVRKFQDRKTAVARIWKRIQSWDEPAHLASPQKRATAPRQIHSAAVASPARRTASSAQGQPATAAQKAGARRQASKTAQVVALLRRKNGVSLAEIMKKMGWQQHTVRGFMAGAMKKAGYQIESFKPQGGERTYRIHP